MTAPVKQDPGFCMLSFPVPQLAQRPGTVADEAGLDGIVFADTQNLAGNPYSKLSLLARSTTQLKLDTAKDNPVTRRPALTASALAAAQADPAGCALPEIGAGDSSLACLNSRPATVDVFEKYLGQVQAYPSGGPVNLDVFENHSQWNSPTSLPKVPVDVVATRSRTIATEVRQAKRTACAVGANTDRVAACEETAHRTALVPERNDQKLSFDASVNVGVNTDTDIAHDLIRGGIGSFTDVSGMASAETAKFSFDNRKVFKALGNKYDTNGDGKRAAGHAKLPVGDFSIARLMNEDVPALGERCSR